MKTLTYGTVPSFEEFAVHYRENITEHGSIYVMALVGTDYSNMNAAGLTVGERMFHQYMHDGKLHCEYRPEQLYRLIENLAELHRVDSDEEYADWAGNFASSILTTLGFEWV